MALTEDKVLVSFEINIQSNTVNVLWYDRILRDGEVISQTPHRGAYELVEGEFPQHIQDQMSITMETLCGQATVSAINQTAELRTQINLLNSEIELKDEELAELNSLRHRVTEMNGQLVSMQNELFLLRSKSESEPVVE